MGLTPAFAMEGSMTDLRTRILDLIPVGMQTRGSPSQFAKALEEDAGVVGVALASLVAVGRISRSKSFFEPNVPCFRRAW